MLELQKLKEKNAELQSNIDVAYDGRENSVTISFIHSYINFSYTSFNFVLLSQGRSSHVIEKGSRTRSN